MGPKEPENRQNLDFEKGPPSKIVFLHGFLGSANDWEGVIGYLSAFQCEALSYPFKIPQRALAVGYSMGGRIALSTYPGPKILLSTHPGLKTLEEKKQRWREDQGWIARFSHEPLEQVLNDWYNQPLFQTLKALPHFETIFSRRCLQKGAELAAILRKESLARQTFFASGTFIYGQLDMKYGTLYRKLGISALEIPGAGHAAHLENPEACARVISAAISALA